MKIVLANRLSVAVGGVEEYLKRIVPLLTERGHEVAFFFEHRTPGTAIAADTTPSWIADQAGSDRGVSLLRKWKPDIIYCNGLDSADLEAAIAGLSPSVYSAHAYFGTCISGRKMHAFPALEVCDKSFGSSCLTHYFPRRCGGLNPVTMVTAFRTESTRLKAIRSYSTVVVHSRHMQEEYRRHGIDSSLVYLPVSRAAGATSTRTKAEPARHLVFFGRLIDLKGCKILIDAVAQAARSLPSLDLTIAGEGKERESLEAHARTTAAACPNLSIRFLGQVDEAQRNELLAGAHALVVPSVWPEPFGMVGLEAAAFGVPAIAFNVGGIAEWLHDDISGVLAPPPSANALAKAIVECIGDSQKHSRLSAGARSIHDEFSKRDVGKELETVFATAARNHGG